MLRGYVSEYLSRRDGSINVTKILILCGFEGFIEDYVSVFLAGKNVYNLEKFKRVQKFVEAPDVRRNSTGSNLVSANSCTLLHVAC